MLCCALCTHRFSISSITGSALATVYYVTWTISIVVHNSDATDRFQYNTWFFSSVLQRNTSLAPSLCLIHFPLFVLCLAVSHGRQWLSRWFEHGGNVVAARAVKPPALKPPALIYILYEMVVTFVACIQFNIADPSPDEMALQATITYTMQTCYSSPVLSTDSFVIRPFNLVYSPHCAQIHTNNWWTGQSGVGHDRL